MDLLLTVCYILGGISLLAVVLYLCGFKEKIIQSTITTAVGEADQYYYLPHARISLKATATIVLEKSADSRMIVNHRLAEIRIEPSVEITPDPDCRVLITYHGNWFTSDEIQVATSGTGLLENAKAVSEDRLPHIIAQATTAATELQENMKNASVPFERVLSEPTVIEIIQETRSFTVSSSDLRATSIDRKWRIPLAGLHEGGDPVVDASFTLENPSPIRHRSNDGTRYDGLLTRPLIEHTVTLKKEGLEDTSLTFLVPDTGSLIKIPVRRSSFVKRQHAPRFTTGLLVDNVITKPSEFEGMISIPINILKAIISIPAQLLQFRITRVQQETEYENVRLELARAREEAAAKQPEKERERIREEIESLKTSLAQQPKVFSDAYRQQPIPQLGKLPPLPEENLENIHENKIISSEPSVEKITASLPLIESARDWSMANEIWDDYDNYKLKTCVPASAAYLLASWTSNANPPAQILHRQIVKSALKAVAPGNDIRKGCRVVDFLIYWKKTGMNGERIDSFRSLKKKDAELLRHAIYWFGGCIVGLQLPESMKTSDKWIYDDSLSQQLLSGHAVCAIGYARDRFKVISFGKVIEMDARFYEAFNDETYMVLSQARWVSQDMKRAPTTPPLSYEQLEIICQGLYLDRTYSI
ncbi:hypothetical protein [Flaviaesturariibacter amylovorans]|uniref:Uncharacterized protein n=1 Tax=Flaviaesturariibacter amylovorans TaxID=1084520 RepID=A0ABP8G7L4_9BACT